MKLTRTIIATTIAAAIGMASPVLAQQDDNVMSGQWMISPNENFCSAVNMNIAASGKFLLVTSGDGDNDGGMFISVGEDIPVTEGEASLSMTIDDWKPIDVTGTGLTGELRGYWLPLGTTRVLPEFPDNFRLKIVAGDRVLLDDQLTGFQGFVKALNTCDVHVTR